VCRALQSRKSLPGASCVPDDRWMDAGPSPTSLAELLPGAAALPAALMGELERRAAVREVAAGTVLLRQRVVVEDLVVLVCGRLATLVEFAGTGDLVVETTEEPGRVFGWSGLRAPERATATVRADTDCRIVSLPIEPVRRGPPRWMAALCEVIAGGLADRSRELQVRWSGGPGAPEGGDDA
jgi:CRP-like cAMP-binding protein